MKIATQALVLGLTVCAFSAYSTTATANESSETMRDAVGSVVISVKQASLNVPDPELAKRVETALDRAPYLDADHITVTSRHGIVILQGMVGSASDLQDALKISNRVGGVKDVIDDLEIWEFGGRNM